MADPFSIIGATATALVWTNIAKEFIESIKGAPEAVNSLLKDLDAIRKPLQELKSLVERTPDLGQKTRSHVVQVLCPALQNCQEVSRNVESALRPYVKADREPHRNVWKRMSFSFKTEKITKLREELDRCKASLSMAINISNMYVCCQTRRLVRLLM